jgi:hypothetical protein
MMALLWREHRDYKNISTTASPSENTLQMQSISEHYRRRMTKAPRVLGWSLVRCEVWKHSTAYALIHSNPRPCPYHVLVSAKRSKITQYGSCRRRVRHDTVSINVYHYTPDTTRQDKKHRCRLSKLQITPPAPSASPCTGRGHKHRHLLFVQHWTKFTNTPT